MNPNMVSSCISLCLVTSPWLQRDARWLLSFTCRRRCVSKHAALGRTRNTHVSKSWRNFLQHQSLSYALICFLHCANNQRGLQSSVLPNRGIRSCKKDSEGGYGSIKFGIIRFLVLWHPV